MPSSSPYSIVYSFGDSLADAGNAWLLTNSQTASLLGLSPEPLSPPYAAESYAGGLTADVFSNGPTSVQNISTDLGLGTLAPSGVDVPVSTLSAVTNAAAGPVGGPILLAAIEAVYGVSNNTVTLAHGVPGGTDFAIGGAVTGFTPENGTNSELTDLNSQFATFQQTVGTPSSSALYTVTIGSNDLLGLLEDPNYGSYSQSQINAAIAASVINEVNFIGSLVADGAKHILVQNVPDLGLTPEIRDNYPTEVAAASKDALAYDQSLASQLSTITGATITIENSYTLIDQAVQSPSAFGLANVTDPIYSGTIGQDNGPLVSTDPSVQDTYLFFDHLHPTEAAQVLGANLALADLGGLGLPVAWTDTTTGTSGIDQASTYSGPDKGLSYQYARITTDGVSIATSLPNIWLAATGPGNNALAATGGGDDVFDGGSGSNFFWGSTSGSDTFRIAPTPGEKAWNSVVNFHSSDAMVIWNATTFSEKDWIGVKGSSQYHGATLQIGGDRVTFAGISLKEAKHFSVQVNKGGNGQTPFIALFDNA